MAEGAAENLKSTSAAVGGFKTELKTLSSSVDTSTKSLTLLTVALKGISAVLPFDDIRRTEDALATLSRTFLMSRAEVDRNARAFEALAKSSKVFSVDSIAQLNVQMKTMSHLFASGLIDVQKFTELGLKAGGSQGLKYAEGMARISKELPAVGMNIQYLDKNYKNLTSSMYGSTAVLRQFGVEGLGMLSKMRLAALGVKDTSDELRGLGAVADSFAKQFKDSMLDAGNAIGSLLDKIAGPKGKEVIGQMAANLAVLKTVRWGFGQVGEWGAGALGERAGRKEKMELYTSSREYGVSPESLQRIRKSAKDREETIGFRTTPSGARGAGLGGAEVISSATIHIQTASINVGTTGEGVPGAPTGTGHAPTVALDEASKGETIKLRKWTEENAKELSKMRMERIMGRVGMAAYAMGALAPVAAQVTGSQKVGESMMGAAMGTQIALAIAPMLGPFAPLAALVPALLAILPWFTKEAGKSLAERKEEEGKQEEAFYAETYGRELGRTGSPEKAALKVSGGKMSSAYAFLRGSNMPGKYTEEEKAIAEGTDVQAQGKLFSGRMVELAQTRQSFQNYMDMSETEKYSFRGSEGYAKLQEDVGKYYKDEGGGPLDLSNAESNKDTLKDMSDNLVKMQGASDDFTMKWQAHSAVLAEGEQRMSAMAQAAETTADSGARLGGSLGYIGAQTEKELAALDEAKNSLQGRLDILEDIITLTPEDTSAQEEMARLTGQMEQYSQKYMSAMVRVQRVGKDRLQTEMALTDEEEKRAKLGAKDPMVIQAARMKSMAEGAKMVQLNEKTLAEYRSRGYSEDSKEVREAKTELSRSQTSLLEKADVARRTWEDMFTEQVIGMPSGTYLQPMAPSGFEALGPSYMTGLPPEQRTKGLGTHLSRTQEMYGMGGTGRTGADEALGTVLDTLRGGMTLQFTSDTTAILRTLLENSVGGGAR